MRTVSEDELSSRLGASAATSPRVVASGNCALPRRALDVVDRTFAAYRLFVLNAPAGLPARPGIVHETPFVGAGMRDLATLDYLPMRLSLVARLFATTRPPDVVVVHTSPPRDDKVSLGIEVNILPSAIEQVRARGGLVVAQVNAQMPYTYGDGELDLEAIDLAIEVDEPLGHPPQRPASERTQLIAQRVADLVGDGATLQLGIGQLPDAVARLLRARRGLKIWSEMVSDGLLELEHSGALAPAAVVQASFLSGSDDLYRFAHGNRRLHMLRTETANDPSLIAANPGMFSINTALQVDLYAQANASYVGGRIYSGFGGQPDFVVGALHSRGGHAIVALASWHDKSNSSTIVPLIAVPVGSFQHSAIVTEHGCAQLFGHSQHAQARALIDETADPRARPGLWEAAARLGLAGT